jgi:RNA polymerase sigma factor (sigma-70 family)
VTPKHLLTPARLAGAPLLVAQRDERLVDLVRAGSEPAFDALVRRYRRPLVRYCSALVGAGRAEDAVQITFVSAYHSLRRDDREVVLKPWLYRIAHNTSLNLLRDPALDHRELDPERAAADAPDEVVERRERLEEVLTAVRSLPERQRDAIVLRELEGRSYEEIAAELGADRGAVRALLNRARNSVRLAASAFVPVGVLLRIPAGAGQPAEGVAGRVAELTAGATAGALATKAAATVLVTGAVAGGAAVVPQIDEGSRPRPDAVRAAQAAPSGGGETHADTGVRESEEGSQEAVRGLSRRVEVGSHERGRHGGDHSGPGRHGSGSGSDDEEPREEGGEHRSGTGRHDHAEKPDGERDTGSDNSVSGSGSSGPGPGGSGKSGPGGSGNSGPGSHGSGSGSSGSGSSGSSAGGSGSGSSSGGSGSGSGGSDAGQPADD